MYFPNVTHYSPSLQLQDKSMMHHRFPLHLLPPLLASSVCCISLFPWLAEQKTPGWPVCSNGGDRLTHFSLLAGWLRPLRQVVGVNNKMWMALPTETSGVNNKMWMALPTETSGGNNKMWMALPNETSGGNNKMWMALPTETSGENNKTWVRTHTLNCADTRCLITVLKKTTSNSHFKLYTLDAWSLFSKTAQAHDVFPLHWYWESHRPSLFKVVGLHTGADWLKLVCWPREWQEVSYFQQHKPRCIHIPGYSKLMCWNIWAQAWPMV